MVYVNSISVLWSEGAFIFEGTMRICFLFTVFHAWKRGYLIWVLTVFALAVPGEVAGSSSGSYCKAESLFMWDKCSELTLHAGFWTFWVYPCVLAIHRLGLPKFYRPFAIGLLSQVNGAPFDLGGAAAGMWYFKETSLPILGTTMYPMAFSQHLFAGLGAGLLVELLLSSSEIESDQAFGYPKISAGKQLIVGLLGIMLGYVIMAALMAPCIWLAGPGHFGVLYIPILVICGLMFAMGMTKRTPPTSTEKDWILFIPPSLFLLCNLGHEVAHVLNGFLVTPVDPLKYTQRFTTGQYITSIEITGACAALGIAIFTFASMSTNAPQAYKPLV